MVWARAFSRVFGSTTPAAATVLAAFMVGIALGSALASRVVDRLARPLRAYAILEAGIALFAAFSMPLIAWVSDAADGLLPAEGGARTAALFATSFLTLMVPTMLMGATLPTLATLVSSDATLAGQSSAGRRGQARGRLSLEILYGANTLGAAAGALLGGFVLLPSLGFQRTLLASAALNVAVALLALVLDRPRESEVAAAPEDVEPLGRGATAAILLFLAASGVATLAYELCLMRVVATTFGSSAYSFTMVVAAFLTGIGLGGVVRHLLEGAAPAGLPSATPLPVLAALGAAAMVVTNVAFGQWPLVSFVLHKKLAGSFWLLQGALYGSILLAVVVPGAILGMTFPAALQALAGAGRGRAAGIGAAVNTAAAAAGSVVVGFWLMPLLGVQGLLVAAALAVGAAAVAMQLALPADPARRRLVGAIALLALLVLPFLPRWNLTAHGAGSFIAWRHFESYRAMSSYLESTQLLFHGDGTSASIQVTEGSNVRTLRTNGKADASTGRTDVHTQLMSAYLPALLHPAPESALLIGLGCGATARALAVPTTMRHVDVVEIEPLVVHAARTFFSEANGGVLDDPRVALHVEDGRRFVRKAARRYDLIVSEPSNPWIAGVSDLYTREHVERVLAALADDGVYLQWVQGYQLARGSILSVLRTVSEVFPEVTLWFSTDGDYLVVASRRPIVLDVPRVQAELSRNPTLVKDLAACSVYGARGLVSRFLLDSAAARDASSGSAVMRDDLPVLEYEAPRQLHDATNQGSNFAWFTAQAVPCPIHEAGAERLAPEVAAEEWRGLGISSHVYHRFEIGRAAYARSLSILSSARTILDWARLEMEDGETGRARQLISDGLAHPGTDDALRGHFEKLLAAAAAEEAAATARSPRAPEAAPASP